MPSYQQRAAPIQQYIAQYDNGRKQGQMNGSFPHPFRTPENRDGAGQWGQMRPYQMPTRTRGPIGWNTGPIPPPRDDIGQMDMGQGDNPWMRDPRLMQWLMSMFGGRQF